MNRELTLTEEEIIPFQVAKGVVIPASFRGEMDDSVYVWMRRFESEAEREKLYAAIYEDEHWKTAISPRRAHQPGATRVQRIVTTSRSVFAVVFSPFRKGPLHSCHRGNGAVPQPVSLIRPAAAWASLLYTTER